MFRYISIILFSLLLALPAFAQDRVVPASRGDVVLSYAPVVKQVSPAVVNIYTQRVVKRRIYSPFLDDPFFSQFFGRSFGSRQFKNRVERALGSGVIVEPNGLIVSNAHVIEDSAEITVVLSDGREFEAEALLVDEPSDLALLQMTIEDDEAMPYIPMRPSDTLEVGDLVLAIGNPFGVGQTVTSGIISALARSAANVNDFNFFIQTDAAINPGNSGGALVTMDGKLVGINTAIYSRSGGNNGIGFAIPSEMVAAVLAAAKSGKVSARGVIRGWVGFEGQNVTSDIAESLDLEVPYGVLVAGIYDDGPADDARMKVGDVVTKLNGRIVRDMAEFKFRMATVPIGQEAEVELYRKGKLRTVSLRSIEPPEIPPRNETNLSGRHPFSGATVVNLSPAVIAETGIKGAEEGVMIIDIASRSQARRIGANVGDIIVSVNGKDIESVDDLEDVLDRYSGKRGWDIILKRNGRERRVVLR